MKNIWSAFLIIFSGAFSQVVSSYEVITHENLSEKALEASTLGKPGVLTRLGLKEVLKDESQQAFPNSDATKQSINALFRSGASFEDNFPRSTNHFFNPYNGQALSVSGVQVGNPSPDWALEDKGQIVGGLVLGGQEYSYRDGRSYFYLALTSSSSVERDRRWDQMFQTLGQVIHHVQDMAQPHPMEPI